MIKSYYYYSLKNTLFNEMPALLNLLKIIKKLNTIFYTFSFLLKVNIYMHFQFIYITKILQICLYFSKNAHYQDVYDVFITKIRICNKILHNTYE